MSDETAIKRVCAKCHVTIGAVAVSTSSNPSEVYHEECFPYPRNDRNDFEGYKPELWTIQKDVIYAAIPAVRNGLEYARECLITHDSALGRTTIKNKSWAETMEKDIRQMESALAMLKGCHGRIDEP